MNFLARTVLVLVAMILAVNTVGQVKLADSRLPTDNEIKVGKLKNGFTYYLRRTQGVAVQVRFIVKAGNNQENEDQVQYAHLIEHMAIGKTAHFNNARVYFTKRGLDSNGFNGTTSNASTYYRSIVPKERIDLLIDILKFYRDCAQDVDFSTRNIEEAKASIFAEAGFLEGKAPDPAVHLMGLTKYKKRAFIDPLYVVKNPKYEGIRQFYDTWYFANFQTLIMVGDFDVLEVEKSIRKLFSSVRTSHARGNSIETYDTATLCWKNSVIAIRDETIGGQRIEFYFKRAATNLRVYRDLKHLITRKLLEKVLAIRHSPEAAPYNISYNANAAHLGPRFHAFVTKWYGDKGDKLDALRDMLIMRERLIRYGISEDEFAAARSHLEQEKELFGELTDQEWVDRIMLHAIYGEAIISPKVHAPLIREMLSTITVSEVNSMLTDLLRINNNFTVMLRNVDDAITKLITLDAIYKLIDSLNTMEITPFIMKHSDDKKIDFDTRLIDHVMLAELADRVDTVNFIEEFDEESKAATLKFSNGLKIILRSVRSEEAKGKIYLKSTNTFAQNKYKESDFVIKNAASYVVSQSGIGPLHRNEMANYFKRNGIDILSPYSYKTYGFNGRFDKGAIEKALQIIHLYMVAPRVDSVAAFNTIQNLRHASSQRLIDPLGIMLDSMYGVENRRGIDFRLSDGQIDKLSAEAFRHSYNDSFNRISGSTFVLTGDFVIDDTLKMHLAKYLGTISGHKVVDDTGERVTVNVGDNIAPAVVVLERGNTASSNVYLTINSDFAFSRKDKLRFMLVRDYLEMKLLERLRYNEMGIYSLGLLLTFRRDFGKVSVEISFACRPSDVDRLIAAVKEEIQWIGENEIDQTTFSTLKESIRNKLQLELKSPQKWLLYIIEEIPYSSKFDGLLDELDMITGIEAKDLRNIATKYLVGGNFNSYVLNPKS